MQKRRLFYVVVLLSGIYNSTCFFSCKPPVPKEKNDVVLQVNLSNTLGLSWVYFKELNVRDVKTIDSFNVRKSGRHSFRFTPSGPGFYLVQTKQYNFITLLLAPGERVELFADGKKMKKDYKVKGSPGSSELQEYFVQTQKNMDKVDTLRKIFEKARYKDDYAVKRLELDSAYLKIFRSQKNYVSNFIRRNKQSIASLFVINQHFGPDLVLTEKQDFPMFEMLDSNLISIYPANVHVLDHHQRVAEFKRREAEKKLALERLQPGNPAPNLKLFNPAGKEITLEALKGKTVLLYFWTAMSGKARQDQLGLIPLYRSKHSKGMEILGVSLDENKEMWKAAIKIDKLPWINVADQQGLKSPVCTLYAVEPPLPVYYIIDRNGKIAGKGRELKEVQQILLRVL